MHIFEISSEQVGRLTDGQLTSLLNRLLILEAEAHAIPVNNIEVGLNIRTGDGGVDASIRWEGELPMTRFLPAAHVVFQCKAEAMGPAKCAAELVTTSGTLKPLVAASLADGALYVLFTTDTANERQKRDRIAAMRAKLVELGHPNAPTARLFVWSSEDIARWANAYLPAIVYVQAVTGFTLLPGLKTWTEWNSTVARQWPYHSTRTSDDFIGALRRTLAVPRNAIRLNGLPGLGKTRLALEALGPYDDGPGLAPKIVYYDAEYAQTELTKHVFEWVRHGRSGILVVDNCRPDIHRTLQNEILAPTSKLSMLTIFSNPSEELRDTTQLILRPCSEPELAEVAKAHTAGMQDSDANKIAHLSGGFIFFVYLLCDAYSKRQGLDDVLVRPDELLRFLWGVEGAPNDEALRAIEACSIFESVDFHDGETGEAASVVEISKVEADGFYRYVQGFVQRGIIEQTGRFIRVRPHPLALRLCRNWWQGVLPKRALEIFNAIPETMVDALCERLRMLNTLPEAREVTAKLCEAAAPFGQAEVLYSVRGARIFRALAEVNPESACRSLHDIIEASSLEMLREDRAPRREWVWALTKLIFHRETYSLAADTLLRLALAENESFSNNATGTLVQTFQVALPGTEATLEERAILLEELFASDEPLTIELALSAADRALRGEYLTRTGGAEDQGSGPPLVDYEPTSFDEVCSYWRRVLASISASVANGRCTKELALPVFASHIRGFVRAGSDGLAGAIISMVKDWGVRPWEAGIDSVRDALRYDVAEAEAARIAMLNSWIADLVPANNDIPGQLLLYVSHPAWSDVTSELTDTTENQTGPTQRKVRELAELCASDFANWMPYLDGLFHGEQRLGFAFGTYLAPILAKCERNAFLEFVLRILKEANDTTTNISLLCGFAQATSDVDRSWTEWMVEQFLSDHDIQRYAVDILSSVSPNLNTLMRLVRLVKDGEVDASSLQRLAFGRSLQHLSASDISQLIVALGGLSDEAAWVALEIGYMSFFGRVETMWPGLREAMRTLLLSGHLKLAKERRSRDIHTWEQTVLKLLEDNDEEFALFLSRQLVSSAAEGVSAFDLPEVVATTLLRSHAETAWPVFASALLGEDAMQAWNLSRFLGRGMRGSATDEAFPLASLDEGVLENWLRENAGAAERAARMVRLVEANGDALQWTRFGRLFIEEFGRNAEVLASVTSNLMSGVSWGPRTPFWQNLIAILDEFDNYRLKPVRHWVKSFKASLVANIAAEQREADARSVGRW
ncbi:hypothetical protein SAMN02787142_0699 [Burkholderia sp. WP9]|uniref:hypothetical protein n=1 Tax=Burkholderia sp. WP9 TaxID=1500263 RepID=UPI000897CAE9|nr:hypothetical protein [Burkholderia sp. WP9]SEC00053.1 hypothetical protein SAMN02787142_0699 [Burkholderia sp. WP9]